jgi:hypothetical protein
MNEGYAPRAPRAAKVEAIARMAVPTAEEKAAAAAALKAAKASRTPVKARGAAAKNREAKAAAANEASITAAYKKLTKEEIELDNLQKRFENVWFVSSRGSVKAEIAANRKIVNQGELVANAHCLLYLLFLDPEQCMLYSCQQFSHSTLDNDKHHKCISYYASFVYYVVLYLQS